MLGDISRAYCHTRTASRSLYPPASEAHYRYLLEIGVPLAGKFAPLKLIVLHPFARNRHIPSTSDETSIPQTKTFGLWCRLCKRFLLLAVSAISITSLFFRRAITAPVGGTLFTVVFADHTMAHTYRLMVISLAVYNAPARWCLTYFLANRANHMYFR